MDLVMGLPLFNKFGNNLIIVMKKEMINLAWVTSGFYSDEKEFRGAAAILNLAKEISGNPDIILTVFSLYYPFNKAEYMLYGSKVFTFNTKPVEDINSFSKFRSWHAFRKKLPKNKTKQI